ncbi:VanW family protein [Neobacillus sp. LXY-1]|uniref:VanW family protein n=1 Tax=Neobacillus sp. LXY-1 TaxID=3379133 RepID=UPI003EE1AF28
MGKWRWAISLLIVSSLVGVGGCSEKTTQKATQQTNPNNTVKDGPKKQEPPKPAVINIVDPTTKAVIKTFTPAEMGYTTDQDSYKKQIEEWAKEMARGTETTPGYDKRIKLDKIDANGQIIKGTPQVILDEAILVDKVMQASSAGGDVELPITVHESGYKPEDAAHLGEVVIASYTTYFGSGVVGRSKNIELSAQAIDNVIVGVNDIFSFNDTVGPSDAEHGYQKAKEIVDKKLVDGIGGGICQTSSTLFNSVDKLKVHYVEWNHHSLSVGYVPKGRDATVSYGGKDFRFQNTTGVPIMINTIYQRGKITIEIRTAATYQSLVARR